MIGLRVVVLAWACLVSAAWADLTGLPQLDDASLSPDGAHLLMLRSNGEVYELAVRATAGGAARVIVPAGNPPRLLNWCRWANNSRILCSWRYSFPLARVGQVTATRLFAVNLDGSDLLELDARARNIVGRAPQYEPQIQDRIVSWLPHDDRQVLVQLNRLDPNRPSVYRLDIYDNRLTRVRKHRSQIRHWYADHSGVVRVGVGFRNGAVPVVFRIGPTPVAYDNPAFESEVPPVPLGFSADGSEFYMSMTHGSDRHGIHRVRYADGAVLGPVFQDPEFDVFGSLVQDPESGRPVGVRYVRHHPQSVWFEPGLAQLFRRLERLLPGAHHQLVSVDDQYRRFLYFAYGGISPGYFLVDRQDGAVTEIARDYPGLADDEVTTIRPVTYPSRDGASIPSYLAVPRMPREGPWPTVILPHGGPYDRDSARFDPWVQFLNSRGIAVLKPNYRGSVGYGEIFMQAGFREWGKRMQEDLVDGVDWLVSEGIADPGRICVVGASYGGYTALVSAYRFTERFRCAVSLAGIANLEVMVRRIYDFDLVNRNRDRVQRGADLRENSPFHHAASFGMPVLIVHGDADTIVDVEQSRRLVERLQAAGKPVEYVEQAGGDHFLSSGGQRREFFSRLGPFLDDALDLSTDVPGVVQVPAPSPGRAGGR